MPFQALKRRILSHYFLLRRGFIVLLFLTAVLFAGFFIFPFLRLSKEVLFGPVNIFSVVFQRPQELKNDNGRTNILILGIGPPEHDGPNLTDTIVILSAKTRLDDKTATVSSTVDLISIPRDIYLDSLQGKINSAYATGLTKDSTAGLIMAKAVASEVTGLPIHYAVRIDFAVFEHLVDRVGGVDINVERAFDDYQYPIDGKENDLCGGDPEFKCRYEHIHFDAGRKLMDGKTALKFVRSRHAPGDEGTDFARARRQQLVIAAVKDKVFSTGTLLDANKLLAIYNELKSHLDTDFDPKELARFIKLALPFRQTNFKNIVLGLDLLDNPPIDERGWILLPKGGSWGEVHQYIQNQL